MCMNIDLSFSIKKKYGWQGHMSKYTGADLENIEPGATEGIRNEAELGGAIKRWYRI